MSKLTQSISFQLLALSVVLCFMALLLSQCKPLDEQLGADRRLEVSSDSVFFDTLVSEWPSFTRNVRVRNTGNTAVMLRSIQLRNSNSPYSLVINGYKTNSLKNIRLLGKDSLLIQVSLKAPKNGSDNPQQLLDYIDINQESERNTVVLSAWAQDVSVLENIELPCNTVFSGAKPYRIKGDVLVPEGCTLTIEAGVTLLFDAKARLLVGGQLKALGTPEKPILMTGTRTEDAYAEAPGQWVGLIFGSRSQGSRLESTIIKNSESGIYIGINDANSEQDLVLDKCQIRNVSTIGLTAFDADLVIINSEFYNCLEHSIICAAGGNYKFYNNTFANYGSFFFEKPAVVMLAALDEENKNALRIELLNNVITGVSQGGNELFIQPDASLPFEALIKNNYIRTFQTALDTGGNIINKDLKFVNTANRLLQPDSLSVLIDAAMPLPFIKDDLTGQLRDAKPDIGAYERKKR